MPTCRCRHVVWDWNGTLLDDVALCLDIMNDMLTRRGLPPVDLPFYRAVIEFPVEGYYRKLGFDFAREPFEGLSDEYIAAYQARWRGCALQPGAARALAALGDAGVGQSVLSASKAGHLTEQLDFFDVSRHLGSVAGVEDHHGRGKGHLAAGHVEALSLPPSSVVFVGDTLHDAEVARSAGASCVLLACGHVGRERLETAGVPVAADMAELLDRLLGG